MRAELLKMRALLTPRIMLALALAVPAVAALITYLVEPDDGDLYHQAPLFAAQIGTEIAAIVVGVWIVAMEFGQGTVRRLLTAEPRRTHVVANKLATAAVTILIGSALVGFVAFWLGALAAHLRDVDYDQGTAAKLAVVVAITGLLAGLLSFALGLLAESLPGGLVLAFAVLFVLDGAVSFVSSIRDYTFTSALGSISARFEPDEPAALDLGPAIAVALAWVVVLMVPGVVRFLRSDFK